MKTEMNFSAMPVPPVKMVMSTMLGFGLVAVIIATVLVFDTIDLWSKNAELEIAQQKLAKRISSNASSKQSVLPNQRKMQKFYQKLNVLSKLDATVGADTSMVMSSLEQLLPDSAYLINFHYQKESGETKVTVESGFTESLSKFLHNIEQHNSFRDVLLVRQLQSGEGNQLRKQYVIQFISRSAK